MSVLSATRPARTTASFPHPQKLRPRTYLGALTRHRSIARERSLAGGLIPARRRLVTWRDCRSRLTVEFSLSAGASAGQHRGLSLSPRRCLMATTSPSTALVPVAPVFTSAERLALAGFLAGYTGLTRQAYELDLRQFASWCQQRQLHLFGARRADIEFFARDLEACGRARANRPVSVAAELWRQEAWLSPWVLPASGRARRQAGGSPSRRRPRGRTMPAGWPAGAGCG